MELVEGPTLAERIAQGPVPLDEARPLFDPGGLVVNGRYLITPVKELPIGSSWATIVAVDRQER